MIRFGRGGAVFGSRGEGLGLGLAGAPARLSLRFSCVVAGK